MTSFVVKVVGPGQNVVNCVTTSKEVVNEVETVADGRFVFSSGTVVLVVLVKEAVSFMREITVLVLVTVQGQLVMVKLVASLTT